MRDGVHMHVVVEGSQWPRLCGARGNGRAGCALDCAAWVVYGVIDAATGLVVLAVARILRASAITTMSVARKVARNGGERRRRDAIMIR